MTSRFSRLLFVAALAFASRPAASLGADPACLAALNPQAEAGASDRPFQVLELRLGLLTDARDTSVAAVRMLSEIARPERAFVPGTGLYDRLTSLMATLGERVFFEYVERLQTDPSWTAAYRQFLARGTPPGYAFDSFYNQSDSAQRYSEFVSVLQHYFSALMVGAALVRSDFPLDGPARIVDAGVGVGDTIAVLKRLMPQARITGFDKSLPLIQATRLRFPDINAVVGDFEDRFPFADGSVDGMTLLFSMNQYLAYPMFRRAAREVFRSLKGGGGWALTEYGPWNREAGVRLPVFIRDLEEIGFEVEYPPVAFQTANHRYFPILMRKWDDL